MNFENLPINSESLPSLEMIEFQMHPTKLRTKQYVVAALILTLLVIPFIVFLIVGLTPGIIISGSVWLLIATLTFLSIGYSFPFRGYAIRTHDITYRKGWLFRSRTTIPFNRIQHSEINQGPLDRKYNLSSLKIFTAGGAASDLTIPGLLPEEAQRLHEFITGQTSNHA